uniref:Uncharacterized protein n=1 Tax=Knipowitschia caucasica TaxID=637954 RepID=A0AAV2ITC6_KNICA
MFLTMTMALTATVMIGFGHPFPLMNHSKLELESSIPVNASLWNKTLDTSNYTDVYMNNVTSNETETTSSQETVDRNETLVFMFSPDGCPLPTCLTVNLVSSLQTGDERAGKATDNIQTKVVFACSYSLCAVVELVDRLNEGGDEVAGHTARHSLGPGK